MKDKGQSDRQKAFNEEVSGSRRHVQDRKGAREVSNVIEKAFDMIYNEAKAKGMAEGRAEARAEREKIGEARLAARMLKDGRYSLEEILEMTGLSAEEISEASAAYAGKVAADMAP